MSKKLPHQHDINDLLKALEELRDDDTSNELYSFENDVPAFLSKFKIEAGDYFIKPSLLYKLYKIFTKEHLNQTEFSISAGNFIPRTDYGFKLNISPQKIIKILNPPRNKNNIAKSSVLKHFVVFLKKMDIKKGNKWVESIVLHEIYRHYCIDNRIHKRLSYENFVSICKMNFEYRRIGSSKQNWLKLDPKTLDLLTPEVLERIRNEGTHKRKKETIKK